MSRTHACPSRSFTHTPPSTLQQQGALPHPPHPRAHTRAPLFHSAGLHNTRLPFVVLDDQAGTLASCNLGYRVLKIMIIMCRISFATRYTRCRYKIRRYADTQKVHGENASRKCIQKNLMHHENASPKLHLENANRWRVLLKCC